MPQIFFHDAVRDDGTPVLVEYSADGGEPYFDHPGHVCDGGGSGPEVSIVDVVPRTEGFGQLCQKRFELEEVSLFSFFLLVPWALNRWRLAKVDAEIERAKAAAALTDAERERIEAWLAEHHEPPDYSDEFF